MKIDGKAIASEIKQNLRQHILSLKSRNIIPHLAVILIGDDPSSLAYVRQKQKVGEEIGAQVTIRRLSPQIKLDQFVQLTKSLNASGNIHGIIIQRPIPINISNKQLNSLVAPKKDIDGFHPNSLFTPPIALAVLKIMEWIRIDAKPKIPILETELPSKTSDSTLLLSEKFGIEDLQKFENLIHWLKGKKILIIGRGVTGGKPIANTFRKMNIPFQIAHSKTSEKDLTNLCQQSNIIISCVGKPNVIRGDFFKQKTQTLNHLAIQPFNHSYFLIGVGLHQEDNILKPDYDQDKVGESVAFYTPVPGGVGPVNVACLFENLIKAVLLSSSRK